MKRFILFVVLFVLLASPVSAHGYKWRVYDISKVTQGFYTVETSAKYATHRQVATVSLSIYGDGNAPYLETYLPFVPKESKSFPVKNIFNGGIAYDGTATCEFYAGSSILYCYVGNRELWDRYGWKGFTTTFEYRYK